MNVNNDFYQDIGVSLVEKNNKKNHKYLYQQRQTITNPLSPVDPLVKEFFGPRVLSLVILSKNYGWTNGTFNWPQAEIDSSIQRIKDAFPNWVKYKVLFWIDYVLANKIVEATPLSAYRSQMDEVATKIEQICMQMGDYGFQYKGKLETGVNETYFQPFVDTFYSES